MMRSNALRSTMRSGRAGSWRAPRLDRDVVAVAELAHVQLAGRGAALGAVGLPLIIIPHEPQMPSRQSWSNAIGSLPSSVSRSFTTSSISRNDMSGLTPGTS
jgi:hypothetical protein